MSLGSIYIVCPGPSMKDFPFEKLRNKKKVRHHYGTPLLQTKKLLL